MCWACHEQSASSYRACDGCSNLIEKNNMQVYDILREWGELAEFIETKQRIMLFCVNYREAMNMYRESTRTLAGETEPSVLYLPEPRQKADRPDAIPVGIHNISEQETLGLGCAQQKYGVDATEEILQGFIYHDDAGHQIRRLTLSDTDETIRCDKCWLELWQCNAREVSR